MHSGSSLQESQSASRMESTRTTSRWPASAPQRACTWLERGSSARPRGRPSSYAASAVRYEADDRLPSIMIVLDPSAAMRCFARHFDRTVARAPGGTSLIWQDLGPRAVRRSRPAAETVMVCPPIASADRWTSSSIPRPSPAIRTQRRPASPVASSRAIRHPNSLGDVAPVSVTDGFSKLPASPRSQSIKGARPLSASSCPGHTSCVGVRSSSFISRV